MLSPVLSSAAPLPLALIDEPLIASDVTMVGMHYMPLDVDRLRDSKTWLRCRRAPQLGYYLINLWSRAWKGSPAGSLEDDDDVLAAHADCPPSLWPEVRAELLRNWLRCKKTGRIYHRVVCEWAELAWAKRVSFRTNTAKARAAKAARAAEARQTELRLVEELSELGTRPVMPESKFGDTPPPPTPETEPDQPVAAVSVEIETAETLSQTISVKSEERAELRSEPARGLVTGVRAELWSDGLRDLRTMTGLADRGARSLLGKLVKTAGDDCAVVMGVLDEAREFGPIDPVAWIRRAVEQRSDRGGTEIERWIVEQGGLPRIPTAQEWRDAKRSEADRELVNAA